MNHDRNYGIETYLQCLALTVQWSVLIDDFKNREFFCANLRILWQ